MRVDWSKVDEKAEKDSLTPRTHEGSSSDPNDPMYIEMMQVRTTHYTY